MGRDVQKVVPSTGNLDGISMTYWSEIYAARFHTINLLTTRDGKCGAWCEFLADIFRCQGLDAEVRAYQAKPVTHETDRMPSEWLEAHSGHPLVIPKYTDRLLYIKNWSLGPDPFNPTRLDGIYVRGKDNKRPTALFSNHALVMYHHELYDPSYGAPLRSSQLEWEDASVAAFGYRFTAGPADSVTKDKGIWVSQPNTEGVLETTEEISFY